MDQRYRHMAATLTHSALGGAEDDLVSEMLSSDYVLHLAIGDHYGAEGVRIDATAWREGFSDLTVTLEDAFGDGDRIARRFLIRGKHSGPFLGIAATGVLAESTGIAIDRLRDGQIEETWMLIDLYGLARQLNAATG